MSRSYWRAYRSLGRGLKSVWEREAEDAERAKNQEGAERKREEAKRRNNEREVIAALEGVAEQIQAAADHQKTSETSRKSWEWPKYGLEIAGTLGLWAAAFVGLHAIYVASCDAEKQRHVMHDQLIAMNNQLNEMRAENGAWLHISKAFLSPSPDRFPDPEDYDACKTPHGHPNPWRGCDGAFRAKVRVVIENVGHTPALNVQFKLAAAINEIPEQTKPSPYFAWPAAQKRACDSLRDEIERSSQSEYSELVSLAPNETWTQDTGPKDLTISSAAITRWKENGAFTPVFAGCIAFRFLGESPKTIHLWGITMTLTSGTDDFEPKGIPASGSLPAGSLRFIRLYNIGEYRN